MSCHVMSSPPQGKKGKEKKEKKEKKTVVV
jgi:hypothetical protein